MQCSLHNYANSCGLWKVESFPLRGGGGGEGRHFLVYAKEGGRHSCPDKTGESAYVATTVPVNLPMLLCTKPTFK